VTVEEPDLSPMPGAISPLALFRGVLDAAPDAMVIVNRDGRIVLVNVRTEEIFNYNRRELLGQPVEVLVPNRFFEAHATHRTGYLAQPRPRPMGLGLELFARRRDGSEFPVEISLSPMATEDDMLVIAAIRDVTERKRLEATVRASRELSTPVLPVRERFLIVPIIGVIDSMRAHQLSDQVLVGIRAHRAKAVVMDITGVPLIDETVANHLVRIVDKARLLGATVILTGVSTAIAQTLVATKVDLGQVLTMGDLQAGIEEAERLLGYKLMVEPQATQSATAPPPPAREPPVSPD
jgi:PAS domain S-box-containing protein